MQAYCSWECEVIQSASWSSVKQQELTRSKTYQTELQTQSAELYEHLLLFYALYEMECFFVWDCYLDKQTNYHLDSCEGFIFSTTQIIHQLKK